MKLRAKVVIMIGLTVIGLIVVLLVTSFEFVLKSFSQLEEADIRENLDRAYKAIDDDLKKLSRTSSDWAYWDETYYFIENQDVEYVEQNLNDQALLNIGVNVFMLVNPEGDLLFSKVIGVEADYQTVVSDELINFLRTNPEFLSFRDRLGSHDGLVLLPGGPVLIAMRGVLTSNYEGQIKGQLIMGHFLDQARIDELADITNLSIQIEGLTDVNLPADFKFAIQNLLSGEADFIQPIASQVVDGNEQIAAYRLLRDLSGRPVMALRVNQPRSIYQQGVESLRYLIVGLLLSGLLFSWITLWFLDQSVITRLLKLGEGVRQIGVSRDFSAQLEATGSDELTMLTKSINSMLVALEQKANDLSALYETSLLFLSFQDPEALDKVICMSAVRSFNLEAAWLDANSLEPDSMSSQSMNAVIDGEYACVRKAIDSSNGQDADLIVPPVIPALSQGAKSFSVKTWCAEIELRGFMDVALPLVSGTQELGVLRLYSKRAETIDDERKRVLISFANQAATARHNMMLYQSSQRQLLELGTVYRVSQSLQALRFSDELADKISEVIGEALNYEFTAAFLEVEESGQLGLYAFVCGKTSVERRETILEKISQVDLEKGFVEDVHRGAASILKTVLLADETSRVLLPDTRSAVYVPLRTGERVMGVIAAEASDSYAFSISDQRVLETIAAQIAISIQNARLFQSVAEQKEQLRVLSTRLAEVVEVEKRNLAQELHDRVGQNLSALSLNMAIIRNQVSPKLGKDISARLDDSEILVEKTVDIIRDVMAELRPPLLDDYGLAAALHWLCQQFSNRTGILSTFKADSTDLRLPTTWETVLFRVAQEALNNVSKHSKASGVVVELACKDPEQVRMIIEDNGIGFVSGAPFPIKGGAGWGIDIMRERVEGIGGSFSIISKPGSGTIIIVKIGR